VTKAKWDKMNTWQKNALVLTTLWKAENGKPIDIKWHRDSDEVFYGEYMRAGKPWKTHEIDAAVVPSFTTDRNACALVLDEIERRDLLPSFINNLMSILGLFYDDYLREALSTILIDTTPNIVCYCAVKAVEDG